MTRMSFFQVSEPTSAEAHLLRLELEHRVAAVFDDCGLEIVGSNMQ